MQMAQLTAGNREDFPASILRMEDVADIANACEQFVAFVSRGEKTPDK